MSNMEQLLDAQREIGESIQKIIRNFKKDPATKTALLEAERLRLVQQQRLCVNCFGNDHVSKTCNSVVTSATPHPTQNINTPASEVVAVTSATTHVAADRQSYGLLATARVIITASNGVSDEFRAILDSASHLRYVGSKDNPADIPSRGQPAYKLLNVIYGYMYHFSCKTNFQFLTTLKKEDTTNLSSYHYQQ
ncbi:hypothetical protein EVAR_71237_1 [Eumeta japonica]|uniref:Uncharacterized protein n=1 Tax=Eumeta variegata TaxID=151549 RepID=A0A4C1TC87_EUMVA|nr:hypothetical protein EVAR_71237_1 [Eumeta japonica]